MEKKAAGDHRRTASGRRHSSTRERLLRELEARSDASIAELVDLTGLHENTVRGHLERLHADGHVRREREDVRGRGRPAWRWQAVGPQRLSAYAGLAATLATALGQVSADPSVPARQAGVTWGAQLAAHRTQTPEVSHSDSGNARSLVIDVMREQGFAPEDDGAVVRLHACPLLSAAAHNTAVVCAVHEGMIEGIARTRSSHLEGSLVPFADDGVCMLHLRASA